MLRSGDPVSDDLLELLAGVAHVRGHDNVEKRTTGAAARLPNCPRQPDADTAFVGECQRGKHRTGKRADQREARQQITVFIQRGGEKVLCVVAFISCPYRMD
jgi:hypothetical protein